MPANTDLTAPKLWIVLARCHRVLAQWAERSIVDLGICLSDFMVLEALLHKGPLTMPLLHDRSLPRMLWALDGESAQHRRLETPPRPLQAGSRCRLWSIEDTNYL